MVGPTPTTQKTAAAPGGQMDHANRASPKHATISPI